jgi:hypothetical protein
LAILYIIHHLKHSPRDGARLKRPAAAQGRKLKHPVDVLSHSARQEYYFERSFEEVRVAENWLKLIAELIALFGAVGLFLYRKHREKISINKAVRAEIRRLLVIVPAHRDWWEKTKNDADQILIPFSHAVYAKQVSNIGELDDALVEKAVEFYGYLDFLNDLQKTRDRYIEKNKFQEFNSLYGNSLNSFIKRFENRF